MKFNFSAKKIIGKKIGKSLQYYDHFQQNLASLYGFDLSMMLQGTSHIYK